VKMNDAISKALHSLQRARVARNQHKDYDNTPDHHSISHMLRTSLTQLTIAYSQ